MNTFGYNVRIAFSGTSHGPGLDLVIEGLPEGLTLDELLIRRSLEKRRPQSDLSTPRRESDLYEIRAGLRSGITDGSPLSFFIPNLDTRSGDYSALSGIPRPGHADYPAYVKSAGTADLRGGGMHSGRLTALFMIIGAIARQILVPKGIFVGSHILDIHGVRDAAFDPTTVDAELLRRLDDKLFPTLDETTETSMKAEISAAKNRRDSVGGIVETAVVGLPAGLGDPLFDSLESRLASILFSVPAVKGIEFGDGFAFAERTGSEVKDEYAFGSDGSVRTLANHNGGILGGMATGMPVVFRSVIKPTSSIGLPQRTVDLVRRESLSIEIGGRHDPAIVNRAVHVIDAAVWYVILDVLSAGKPKEWFL
jgi:chorismate synthase